MTEHGYPVDRQLLKTEPGKAIPQHRQHDLASPSGEPAGQGHVEAELLHHIGIAPAIEIVALPWRQRGRLTPGAVGVRKRGAIGIEVADAIGGEPRQFGHGLGRNDRDKTADRIDYGPDQRYRSRGPGEALTGFD